MIKGSARGRLTTLDCLSPGTASLYAPDLMPQLTRPDFGEEAM